MRGGGERRADAARKRVAIEMIAKHERALRRTAGRYSICAADAEDAFQRAIEILLTKAPPGEARELVRWMQTVTKHEALAVRRSRERQLSPARPTPEGGEEPSDWMALLPSTGPGPAERAERREDVARSREALSTLKPAELRALTLLAEGYSYAEIGEITGFSRTKVNRCLAEGRERFRAFLTSSESGERCVELRPVLSAFCDGEASPEETRRLREHLRACGHCRAALRAYRAAPGAAAGLLAPPLALRGLWDRVHEALQGLGARVAARSGSVGGASAGQLAASGGARGGATAALAKALAVCVGAAGGAAICVGAAVVHPPLGEIAADRAVEPRIERATGALEAEPSTPTPTPTTAADAPTSQSEKADHPAPAPTPAPQSEAPAAPEAVAEVAPEAEYEQSAPAPEPAPAASPPSAAPQPTASPAGEFGP